MAGYVADERGVPRAEKVPDHSGALRTGRFMVTWQVSIDLRTDDPLPVRIAAAIAKVRQHRHYGALAGVDLADEHTMVNRAVRLAVPLLAYLASTTPYPGGAQSQV